MQGLAKIIAMYIWQPMRQKCIYLYLVEQAKAKDLTQSQLARTWQNQGFWFQIPHTDLFRYKVLAA